MQTLRDIYDGKTGTDKENR